MTSKTKQNVKITSHSDTLLSNLNSLRKKQKFCDVLIIVEDNTVYAHKAVLSAFSQYFSELFENESTSEGMKAKIKLDAVSSSVFQTVIEFIYTGNITISEENASSILKQAFLFQMNDLCRSVEKYLIEKLSVANCLEFYEHRIIYSLSLEDLVIEMDKFFLKHFEQLIQQEAFFQIGADELETFLKSDLLAVKEEKSVYKVVLKWVSLDLENRRDHFPRLFKQVRLQFVPIKYVTGVIRKNDLVRQFAECRDLVEDAFFFYINPELVKPEAPRPSYESYVPEPDSLMIVYPSRAHQLQFNVSNKTWTQTSGNGWKTNLLHTDCSVAVKHVNYMFCGGRDQYTQASNSVIHFNGLEWKIVASMNESRSGCASVYYKNDLYVFGGEKQWIDPKRCYYDNGTNPHTQQDFVENFEVFNDQWRIAGKLTSHRSYACAEIVHDKVFLIGGFTLNENNGHVFNHQNNHSKIPCNSTDIYHIEESKWTNGPVLNNARAAFGSVIMNSTIYVVGGYGENSSPLNSVEFLDTTCGVWTKVISNGHFTLSLASACRVQSQIYLTSPDTKSMVRFDSKSFQWLQEQGSFPCNGGLIIPIWIQSNQMRARSQNLNEDLVEMLKKI